MLCTIYSLQSCRKPIKGQWKGALNNTVMDNQSLSFYNTQSRRYSDKQMQNTKVGDRFLSSWSLSAAGDVLKQDRNVAACSWIQQGPNHHPPAMNCPGPRYCWQRCLQLQATLYVHIQASGNDFYTNLVWKHPNFHQKNPLGTAKAPLNNGCKKKKKSFTQDSLRILLTLFKSKAVTLSDL